MRASTGTVYLLHFDRPYFHAKHYLGFTPGEVEDRVREHQCGRGARLVEVVTNAGIALELVRTWNGDRKLERRLKSRHAAPRLCPTCSPDRAMRQAREAAPAAGAHDAQ
jgi:hypothetical protein